MTPHDLLANFETLVEAPNGVQRLRELVLELAVRGKLVEQDKADEPAAELLKLIKAEKTRFITSGAIRGGKHLPDIGPDEAPFELPHNWRWSRLRSISHDLGQKVPDVLFSYIDVGSIDNQMGRITESPEVINPEDAPSRARKRVSLGTVIFSTVRPYLLNIAVVTKGYKPEPIVSTAFAVLHPFQGIDSTFLFWVLRSPFFMSWVADRAKGVAYPAISDGDLQMAPVPVPPAAEQRRIVARVDELMSLLDRLEAKRQEREAARTAARDSALAALREAPTPDDVETAWLRIQERFHELFATPEDVEPLRQAILQLAVVGRLVSQNPDDTNAAVVLREIQECRRQWIKVGKMRAGKPSSAISETEIPFRIPKGWALARLGDVLSDIQPGWSPQCEGRPRIGVEWGVLKVSACSWGRFLPEENKALPVAMEAPMEIEVQPGDWIISRANTTELVGRSVLASECPPHLLLSDKTLRLVPMSGFSPRWGNLINHAPSSRAHYAANAGGTSASMRNISQDVIRSLVIAIPPIEEQKRIHAKFEALMAVLDRLVVSLDSERNLASAFAAAAVHHLEA